MTSSANPVVDLEAATAGAGDASYAAEGRPTATSAASTASTAPASTGRGAVSEERIAELPSGMNVVYQTFGEPSGDPLLLVMGLGGPMTWWNPDLCLLLARKGFFVIRYDNRDVGRSSKVAGPVTRGTILRRFAGMDVAAPYSISDMAGDGLALLAYLGVDSAHVAGVSMGGMIAQTIAVESTSRTRSLTSIMSTTGRRSVGWQDPRLIPLVLGRRRETRSSYIESSTTVWQMIGSPAYPEPPEAIRARAAETFDRGISPEGVSRQTLAILDQPDRTPALNRLRIPALVIHGLADRMVHVSGGRATARAIPGAELLLVPGMGHDLPPALHETFAAAIRRTADRAG